MTAIRWICTVAAAAAMHTGGAAAGDLAAPTPLPEAPKLTEGEVQLVSREALLRVGSLDSYSEPDWVSALVAEGKLPPVSERLPETPIIEDMAVTPHGTGRYGGVLRHVTGGRPEGWNWGAGQTLGWGGLNMTHEECLTNTGSLWQVKDTGIDPLPNLASS